MLASLEKLGLPKQPRNQHSQQSEAANSLANTRASLGQPRLQRTKPIIWCAAVLCFIFSLVLIFFGIATLIFYFAIKPRNPTFDIPNASLNVVYFDSPQYLNGEFTLLANFSNPNRRIGVRFESLTIELFYSDRLISSQTIKPFTQRPRENRLQSVNLISSLVFLPQDVGVKLQRQVESDRVNYNARGTFKVRFNMGLIHLSHWLHTICQIEMTSPPTGILVARQCITNR
ncbi:YLS9 protein [Spatholobus suberectus]|nr:YLS9 protein [Spatholobus suberectus]